MKSTIQSQVKDDLKHIPRGSLAQNMLRGNYSVSRQHEPSKSKAKILKQAIEVTKKQFPNFEPKYDHEYFLL